MQHQTAARIVWVLVQVVDALSVEKRRAALHTVHQVLFVEQKLTEIGAVLSGDAR